MKIFRCLFIVLILLSCSHNPVRRESLKQELSKPLSKQLKPFVSDGCSKWNEGTRHEPTLWLRCCVQHDYSYWLGGTESERLRADKELKSCVREKSNLLTALVMYLGVRLGGDPFYDTQYSWGYGWNYQRGYLPLTPKERLFASKLSPWKPNHSLQYVNPQKL